MGGVAGVGSGGGGRIPDLLVVGVRVFEGGGRWWASV